MEETPAERTTRSGRAVRRVVRYEPDPDTVFEDENDYSEGCLSDDDLSEDCNSEMDESVSGSEIDSEVSEDDYEEEEEQEEELETVATEEQDMEDVLDWDRLTELAESEDISETELSDLEEDE